MKAKILIVGGGVMGTSIAMRTSQRTDSLRAPVVLLEKSEIGAGSSGRSGAILRQFYANRQLAVMARDSIREYASFEARTGRSIGFVRSGVLTLAGPERKQWCDRVREVVTDLAELGIDIHLVEGSAIRELIPGLKVHKSSVAAWEPEAGYVEPQKTLASFAALSRSYGAITRLGVSVEDLIMDGSRVVGARTTEGDYEAEQVVLVAGPWSGGFLKKIGVELPLRIIRPENHFIAMADSEAESEEESLPAGLSFDTEDLSEKTAGVDTLAPRGLHPSLIDLEYGFYCRCEPRQRRTRLGRVDYSHDQVLDVPEDLEEEVSEETRAWLRETMTRRMPDYENQPDAGSSAAWYTLTPDAQPMIGPVPGMEGFYIVTGFSGHGFKLAPSVGEGVAQMLFGEPVTSIDLDFFAPARFAEGHDWNGHFGM